MPLGPEFRESTALCHSIREDSSGGDVFVDALFEGTWGLGEPWGWGRRGLLLESQSETFRTDIYHSLEERMNRIQPMT